MGLNNESCLRKLEHVDVVLKERVEGPNTTWFEYVFLVHQASSEIPLGTVNLETLSLRKS